MPFAELDRVALVVDDLEAVAASLREVFGIDLLLRDAKALGLRAGAGHNGIELVEPIVPDPRPAKHWRRPLAALCIRVENAAEANARMQEAGFELVQTAVTPGGLREYFYGANFHGIPLVLHETSGDLLKDIGHSEEGSLEVDWKD